MIGNKITAYVLVMFLIISILSLQLSPKEAFAKTYYIYVADLPEHWKDDFDHVLPEAKQYWKNRIGINFVEITQREKADFAIQWASEYQGTKLGYWNPSSVNEFGIPYIAITLGYMDDESVKWQDRKFNLVDPEYATLITTHEIGHAIGFEHSTDPNDIMYTTILNYEMWLSNKQRQQEKIEIRMETFLLQKDVNEKIEEIKPLIYEMQDLLYSIIATNSQQEERLDKAWSSFGLAKSYFDNVESAQRDGEQAISQRNLSDAYWKYKHALSKLNKIQEPLSDTENLVNNIQNVDDSDVSLEEVIESKIPKWVRDIALWYGEGTISEDEFIGAIQYLIKEGIIKV